MHRRLAILALLSALLATTWALAPAYHAHLPSLYGQKPYFPAAVREPRGPQAVRPATWERIIGHRTETPAPSP